MKDIPEGMKRVKNIADGVVKAATGANQDLYLSRLSICAGTDTRPKCGHFNDKGFNSCSLCGCASNLKLRVKSEHCPAEPPKW